MKRPDYDDLVDELTFHLELCEKQRAELLKILRVAEKRNEVLCGIIRLHDGLYGDRREAAKRRSLVVGNLCCFW